MGRDGIKGDETAAELEKLVYDVLVPDFLTDAAVASIAVAVEDELDFPAYRIIVVLAPGHERIGPNLVGFVRHLRGRMRSDRFPLVSYISREDADRLQLAAA